MTTPRRPCLLMLDFDGVIADSLDVFRESLYGACQAHGQPLAGNRDTFLGIFDVNMIAGLNHLGLSDALMGPVLNDLGRRLTAAMDRCPPFPGIPAIITSLAAACPTYVITSNLTAVVSAYLYRHHIHGIRAVAGADQEPSKQVKIRRIAAQWPDHDPVYVGDTLGDMNEAHAAGVGAAAALWGWHAEERLRRGRPDRLLRSPEDLRSLCPEAPGTLL
jgi:phosphoglycolate phosphatase-like HAD superfamily hydrolase